jgi:hypothetical protein
LVIGPHGLIEGPSKLSPVRREVGDPFIKLVAKLADPLGVPREALLLPLNLQDFVGKKVTLVGTKRENNNFAFPAYFVLAVE